jgi:hypothetical protein
MNYLSRAYPLLPKDLPLGPISYSFQHLPTFGRDTFKPHPNHRSLGYIERTYIRLGMVLILAIPAAWGMRIGRLWSNAGLGRKM